MTEVDAPLRDAIHDLQARLGSIRLAVSAVAELDLDASTRATMLTTASEEAVRASVELAAVGALAVNLLDDSAPSDARALSDAVVHAVELARSGGVEVSAAADPSRTVGVSGAHVESTLLALLRLVAGPGKAVSISVEDDLVEVVRTGEDAEPLPAIATTLVAQLGAQREDRAGDGIGIAFRFGDRP